MFVCVCAVVGAVATVHVVRFVFLLVLLHQKYRGGGDSKWNQQRLICLCWVIFQPGGCRIAFGFSLVYYSVEADPRQWASEAQNWRRLTSLVLPLLWRCVVRVFWEQVLSVSGSRCGPGK